MASDLRYLRRYWRSFTPEFRAWLRRVDASTPLDEIRRELTAERDRSRTDPALMPTGDAYAGWVLLNPLLEKLPAPRDDEGVASESTTAQARALLAICTRVQSATEGDAYIAALDDYDAAVEDVARLASLCERLIALEATLRNVADNTADWDQARTPAQREFQVGMTHRIASAVLRAVGD